MYRTELLIDNSSATHSLQLFAQALERAPDEAPQLEYAWAGDRPIGQVSFRIPERVNSRLQGTPKLQGNPGSGGCNGPVTVGGLPWGVNWTPRKTSFDAAVASTVTSAPELVSVMAIRVAMNRINAWMETGKENYLMENARLYYKLEVLLVPLNLKPPQKGYGKDPQILLQLFLLKTPTLNSVINIQEQQA